MSSQRPAGHPARARGTRGACRAAHLMTGEPGATGAGSCRACRSCGCPTPRGAVLVSQPVQEEATLPEGPARPHIPLVPRVLATCSPGRVPQTRFPVAPTACCLEPALLDPVLDPGGGGAGLHGDHGEERASVSAPAWLPSLPVPLLAPRCSSPSSPGHIGPVTGHHTLPGSPLLPWNPTSIPAGATHGTCEVACYIYISPEFGSFPVTLATKHHPEPASL